MIINARVSGQDPRSYVLSSGGREVGWLRAGVIGFCRLPEPLAVRHAADVAAEELAEWYRERWRSSVPVAWADAVPPESQVTTKGVVVGRLLTSGECPCGDETPGFALRVPHELWIAISVELAQRIYSALHQVAPTIGSATQLARAELQAR